jgi:hypothetical protein
MTDMHILVARTRIWIDHKSLVRLNVQLPEYLVECFSWAAVYQETQIGRRYSSLTISLSLLTSSNHLNQHVDLRPMRACPLWQTEYISNSPQSV